MQADVTSLDEMKAAVAQTRRRFGKISGVFHAAGVLDDGPLMLKTADRAARVLDPKVRGTLVLGEALRDEPLDCFVLFSTISSILPPAGQVDYAAANAFLDAFAVSRKGPVIVINWGAWREIGVAARAISPHPWLGERLLDSPNDIVYADRFSQQRRWVLSEHRFKNGIALIPGTGHLEMVAGAFTHGSLQGAIEFRNVFFLAPLMFSPDESKEVRVQLRREHGADAAKGAFRFSVFAHNGQWAEHCSGIIAPCRSHPAARWIAPPSPPAAAYARLSLTSRIAPGRNANSSLGRAGARCAGCISAKARAWRKSSSMTNSQPMSPRFASIRRCSTWRPAPRSI